jgi:hypothetical protein
MQFEAKIGGNEVWVMRAAGVQMDAYQELYQRVVLNKTKLPATVTCAYFLSDPPAEVQLTMLASHHFKIEVADEKIGRSLQTEIARFAAAGKQDKKALHARLNEILEPDGLDLDDVSVGEPVLSRRAQEALMRLCEEVHFIDRFGLYWIFTRCETPKADRAFVARWLVRQFAAERDPKVRDDIGAVFFNHKELALPELAEDLIALIKNSRYGGSRSGLIDVLPKTRHPAAADVIVSVMDEDCLAWSALRSLGALKAKQHEARLRKYLHHPDAEVKREAKRALTKMGCQVETPPPPVHLVKNRKLLPKGLAEWSANLDFEDLEPVLKTVGKCIEKGFGAQEISEVMGVAEATKPEQTKVLRFPITANGQKSELWLVIFMDDIDAPDLEIHGAPRLIKKLGASVDLKE